MGGPGILQLAGSLIFCSLNLPLSLNIFSSLHIAIVLFLDSDEYQEAAVSAEERRRKGSEGSEGEG